MAVDQWVATESTWDGGNLKISVNGGSWTLIPSSSSIFNPHNSALAGGGNDNPMAGEAAFTGSDGGGGGSWGQSQVTLAGLASPGDTIRLRFEFGVDGCNGDIGWYVDDVNVHFCSAPTAVSLTSFGENAAPTRSVAVLLLSLVVIIGGFGLGLLRRQRTEVFRS